jgi:hypothetical protein
MDPMQHAHLSQGPPTLFNSPTLANSTAHTTSHPMPHTVPIRAGGDSASTDLAGVASRTQSSSECLGFFATQSLAHTSGDLVPPVSFSACYPRSTCGSQVSLDASQKVTDPQDPVEHPDRVPTSTRSSVVGRASWVQELLDGHSHAGSEHGDKPWLAGNRLSSSLRKTGQGSGSYMAMQHQAESLAKTVEPRVVQQYMLPTQSSLQHAHSLGVSRLVSALVKLGPSILSSMLRQGTNGIDSLWTLCRSGGQGRGYLEIRVEEETSPALWLDSSVLKYGREG